jgi:hypothetical protein
VAARPDYVPPIRFGEGRRARSPRAVLWELVVEPPASTVFGLVLLVNSHVLAGVVALVFAVVAAVQAVI